jgi:hypothetical protein
MKKSELKSIIREVVEEVKKMENPCWKGYKAYGTKNKGGKEVPNCVPVNEEEDFGDGLRRELRNALKKKNAEKAVYYKQALSSPTVAVAGFDKQFKGSWAYDQWLKKNAEAIAAQNAEFKRFAFMGEVEENEGEDCPHCENQGWYVVQDKYTGDPELEQCKWCHTNPKSKFNMGEKDLEETYESTKWDMIPEGDEHTCEGDEFYEMYGDMNADATLEEAEYRGRKVKLGKPMRGDVKKFKVFVKNPTTGNVKKVNFGDPNMRIKKSNPKRRKSFRARHKCSTAKDRTSARYWSCRKW